MSQSRPRGSTSGRIASRSRTTVSRRSQLLRRTWKITDASGAIKHVHGEGVVGEQPVIGPGQAFEYVSGTPLATPSGFMTGAYHLVERESGTLFDVAIPVFSLDSPHANRRVH